MKKSRPKLVLCKETLRALSSIDLSHVIGAQDTDAARADDLTLDKVCPAPAVAPGR
jgi:hypothetical protein